MTRQEKREIKRKLNRQVADLLKIQNHYFPKLISDIKNVMDARHQSYVTYEIEVILYVMIMKNVCSIESMSGMVDEFNEDECVRNIYKILGLEERDYLPHYVTINECLSKLDPRELEKVRKGMVYALIRKKSFNGARFLGKHWLVIVDATQLFSFKERHCEHCLTKTFNKGTPEERTVYYHQVLEAKLVLGDDIVVSIATEFMENETENVGKQDCERKSFQRLAETLKRTFPRLPICLMGDSLYACEPVFETCRVNKWEFLIRYKDGSIPTLAAECEAIDKMGESERKKVETEKVYPRKPREHVAHKMKWVNDLEYQGHAVAVMELEIETEKIPKRGKGKGETASRYFQWLTSLRITGQDAHEFAMAGRKRWMIENEGFNTQKNHRYIITHANSTDYNAMKNHYLLTQIADFMLQLYENGIKGVKAVSRTISKISEGLLDCLKKQSLTEGELRPCRMQVRKNNAP